MLLFVLLLLGSPLLLAALVLFFVWPGAPRRRLRQPFFGRSFAHRGLFGAQQCPPENSLPAFAAAAQNGYGIELDVQFIEDRQLVVFHDDTLDRMTAVRGGVQDTPWPVVSALPLAGSGEHAPLFADVLRTVADANPSTPLIVEIKSRYQYRGRYLADLCRSVLDTLKKYPGPYCIESFDPRVVRLVRRLAPDVVRGQLVDSYRNHRVYGTAALPAYLLSHCFGNLIARPDFIAWCPDKRNWAIRLCAAVGAMTVMWTAMPGHDIPRLERDNDAVIFQWYDAQPKYK